MTFSSASVSACEVDDVAATAAGVAGLRAGGGGKAACWRVAGAMAARAAGAGAVFLAAVSAGRAGLGTTLRAIGRGLGSGTFALAAQASATNADHPTASARLVANALDRNAAARMRGFTAFLRGESFNG
jgi:hypothetical protein